MLVMMCFVSYLQCMSLWVNCTQLINKTPLKYVIISLIFQGLFETQIVYFSFDDQKVTKYLS